MDAKIAKIILDHKLAKLAKALTYIIILTEDDSNKDHTETIKMIALNALEE